MTITSIRISYKYTSNVLLLNTYINFKQYIKYLKVTLSNAFNT